MQRDSSGYHLLSRGCMISHSRSSSGVEFLNRKRKNRANGSDGGPKDDDSGAGTTGTANLRYTICHRLSTFLEWH